VEVGPAEAVGLMPGQLHRCSGKVGARGGGRDELCDKEGARGGGHAKEEGWMRAAMAPRKGIYKRGEQWA
jgi:hypothetical protein